ncbi:hypothetical protein MTO96_039666 [Rhipicephalus appendiculatus]
MNGTSRSFLAGNAELHASAALTPGRFLLVSQEQGLRSKQVLPLPRPGQTLLFRSASSGECNLSSTAPIEGYPEYVPAPLAQQLRLCLFDGGAVARNIVRRSEAIVVGTRLL